MDSHTTPSAGRSLFRKFVVLVGTAGLLGSAIQAQAAVERERLALEARVDAARKAIDESRAEGRRQFSNDEEVAQWWNNWPNWGNFRNWLNR